MKSNLLSGVTPSRVSGRRSISVSKVERILSKRDRREGLRISSWVSVCFFAISVSWIIYLRKDTISYRILQVITGYYTIPPVGSPDPPERSGESWIKIPHRGRSGGVFGTAQGAGIPGICPGLLGAGSPRSPDTTFNYFSKPIRAGSREGDCTGSPLSQRESPRRRESPLLSPRIGGAVYQIHHSRRRAKQKLRRGFFYGVPRSRVRLCCVGRGIVFAGEGYNLQHKDTDFSPHSHSKYLLFPEITREGLQGERVLPLRLQTRKKKRGDFL